MVETNWLKPAVLFAVYKTEKTGSRLELHGFFYTTLIRLQTNSDGSAGGKLVKTNFFPR